MILRDARLLTSVAVLSMGMALCAVPALAQATDAQAADKDSGGLEEIIVTAQRRTENLQNVPLSVVAVGGGVVAGPGADGDGLERQPGR